MPLISAGDRWAVRARIGGQDTGLFLLQADLAIGIVDRSIGDRYAKLTSTSTGAASAAGAVDLVCVPDMSLGAAVVSKMAAASRDLSDVTKDAGLRIGGFVGMNFFCHAPVTFDFQAGQLIFHDPDRFTPPPGAVEVPLRMFGGLVAVPASVEGRDGWFALDIGGVHGVRLATAFIRLHPRMMEGKWTTTLDYAGLSGESTTRLLARFSTMQVFSRDLGPVQASFSPDPAVNKMPAGLAGAIGHKLLSGARLTIDESGGRAWAQWPPREPAEALANRLRDAEADLVGRTPLMRAAAMERGDAVRLLLQRGADANAQDHLGATALLLAARYGDLDSVRALIEKGANPNRAAKNGESPLRAAIESGSLDIVKALLTAGADPNATDNAPVLMWAARMGQPDIVEALLRAGARPQATNPEGFTPLFLAAATGEAKIARFLLDRGADANSSSKSAVTPLMGAAASGNVEIVQLLLAKGAKIDAQDAEGRTALMFAAERNSGEAARCLLAAGADPAIRSAKHGTARQIAASRGTVRALEWLVER